MTRFENAFASLPKPAKPGRFAIEASTTQFRVGKSFEGYPAILIAFDARGGRASAPRRLANIWYTPPARVEISGDTGERAADLAILECRSTDEALVACFFRVATVLLDGQATTVGEEDFEVSLDTLVTLFRALQRPGARSVQGLWSELAVILWSENPVAAITAWHTGPRALHDFAAGGLRLEVKSTLKGIREHRFLLDQLASVQPGMTLIASLLLEEADDGDSVLDLSDAIGARITKFPEAKRRLERIVCESLGSAWREAGDELYSLEKARTNLLLYSADAVPSVPQPLPAAVKEVSFTVDLSGTPDVELSEARRLADFFRDLLPAAAG